MDFLPRADRHDHAHLTLTGQPYAGEASQPRARRRTRRTPTRRKSPAHRTQQEPRSILRTSRRQLPQETPWGPVGLSPRWQNIQNPIPQPLYTPNTLPWPPRVSPQPYTTPLALPVPAWMTPGWPNNSSYTPLHDGTNHLFPTPLLHPTPAQDYLVPAPRPRTRANITPRRIRPRGLRDRLLRRSTPEGPPQGIHGPPPASYRPDFRRKPSRFRSWLSVGQGLHGIKLSPFIAYTSEFDYPMSFDLRYPTYIIRHDAGRPLSHADMHQMATKPPVHYMRLYHPSLPWYIDVHSTDASGITIRQVIESVVGALSEPTDRQDVYNDVITADERERIRAAQEDRVNGDSESLPNRVDFLMNQVVFNGLEKGTNGMWLMKTSKV